MPALSLPEQALPMHALPAHLLLVDDHQLFRTGLRLIVQDHPAVGRIDEAGTVAQACALAASLAQEVTWCCWIFRCRA